MIGFPNSVSSKRFVLWIGIAAASVGVAVLVWRATSGEEVWPPPVIETDGGEAPVLSPDQAIETFSLPPDFRVELVAAEPLVQDPVAIDIDPSGRLWVVEMRGYMTDVLESESDYEPRGQIVVLEDDNQDGRMDRKTVFLDSLVLPRSVLVTHDGMLVGAPPHLWLARDTDGDLKADEKQVLRDDYGDPKANPEWLPNSLVWGIDNWVHTTQYDTRLRYTRRGWQYDSTRVLGQWGLTMGNEGHLYRTYNSDPLVMSMLDTRYYRRNPDLVGADGMEVSLAEGAKEVWPIHTTEGVNRGYREGVLREDNTLRTFTAASGPAVYRGDRYPTAFQGDVFVPEPAANLVRRFEITHKEDGTVEAANAYNGAEFMASTDERFRPVNLASAPDGTLYVVDMYRGVIQHRSYLTQYLKDYIRQRGLVTPIGLGRIYRIVYETHPPREEKPRLLEASNEQLAARLADPNGWWRDTAQQLLVERGATGIAPVLREMVRSAEDRLARLHALWTLEGMGVLSFETVRHALQDEAPTVRAAALRVSEPWLREAQPHVLQHVSALVRDPAPEVRLQLAASLGEAPAPAADSLMVDLLSRAGSQPYLVDAVVSGLQGRELSFLRHLVGPGAWQTREADYAQAVQTLAATIINAGRSQEINHLWQLIGDENGLPQWQRLALLEGIEELIPEGQDERVRLLWLDEEPAALARAVQAADPTVRRRARDVADRLTWPGKPGYDTRETTLVTAGEKRRFRRGQQQYLRVCATCHKADGTGQENLATSLVGSEWVLGQEKDVARIVLDGKEGKIGLMPPQRHLLSDEEIAAILTYIRNAWGNEAAPVAPATVEDVRSATATRQAPWTAEELKIIEH